jgi:hypothetical protein
MVFLLEVLRRVSWQTNTPAGLLYSTGNTRSKMTLTLANVVNAAGIGERKFFSSFAAIGREEKRSKLTK